MNKIYRRLWSAARQCWVVASELAAARGTRRHPSRGPGLALMLAMLPASVMAATAGHSDTSADEWTEDALYAAFGPFNTSAMLAHEDAATAPSGRAFSRANALPLAYSDFVQLGSYAGARDRAVAVGVWAFSNSYGAALGYQANANGQYATALGHKSVAWELGGVAVGNDAKSYAHNAVALGSGALASGRNSVVLGADSNDYGDNQVSVGNGSMRRKIVYLADGAVDANSSDAVTGRQLHATQQALASVSQSQKLLATGTAATNANAAQAVGNRALAMGIGSTADGDDTVALGGGARTASGSGISRIAIGAGAFAGTSGWTGAIALGGSASSTHDGVAIGYQAKTSSSGTTALGRGATVTHGNSVALGANSVTSSANTVSVGNSNNKRRIQYLADGVIAAGSTDAITGNQLHATNASVAAAAATASAAKASVDAVNSRLNAEALALGGGALAESNAYGISTAVGRNARGYNGKSVALGDDARSGVDKDGNRVANANGGVSVGAMSRSGNGAVAAGLQASAVGDRAIAVGHEASADVIHATAIGYQSKASAGHSTALGRGTHASGLYATAMGNLARASAESAVAIGDRSLAQHNGSVALGNGSQTSAANQISVGSSAIKRKLVNLADGTLSTSSTEAVTGKQLNATNANVTTAQNAANAAQTAATGARTAADNALGRATALSGLVSQVSATGNVRLGVDNAGTVVDVANKDGAKRRVNNVANGVLSGTSTDVVTGQQLHATNQSVSTQGQSLVLHGQQLATHTQALTAQDQRVAANRADIDQLRTDVDDFDPDLDGVVKFSADRQLVDMEGARVSGVAAGDVSSAASTDAVNGGQLFSTNERVTAIETAKGFVQVGVDGESQFAQAGLLGVAIGDSAEAAIDSDGATAIGAFARARGQGSVALGRGALVVAAAQNGFSLGTGSNVYAAGGTALGSFSQVESGAENSVALGNSSIAEDSDVVSVGNSHLTRRVVNVGRGVNSSDATTVAQLRDAVTVFGGGADLGPDGNIVSPSYGVQGGVQHTVGDALDVLDGAVLRSGGRIDGVENQLRATFQQSPSTNENGIGQLNLAGAQGMVLSNLADGRIDAGSRDAVTGSQLYAAKQEIARNGDEIERMKGMSDKGVRHVLQQAHDERGGPIDFAGSRLTGIDSGDISSAFSTDAVNGSQLYVTNERIASVESTHRFFKIGRDDLSEDAKAGSFGVAIGESAQATPQHGGEGGTAVGAFAIALGMNSVALGRGALVEEGADSAFALGVGSRAAGSDSVALGAVTRTEVGAVRSAAIGMGSVATEADTASFGNSRYQRRLVNVANGRNTSDAATIGQLRGALSALGGDIDVNGNVTTPGFNVQGQHQNTINEALATLNSAVVTADSRVDRVETQLRSVFQESPSIRSDGTAQLTLAGANGMVISNVANGLIAAGSREAVNGGQLHAAQQQLNGRIDGLEQRVDGQPQARAMATASAAPTEEIMPSPEASGSPQVASAGEGASPASQPKAKKDDSPAPTPQVDTAELEKMLARANEYTDGAISNFERRLDKMDKRFNRMAAMSSAQTAMAMNTAGLATYNRLGAGVGYAEGESAMAVGYQRVLNDKGSATFSLNGAFTNSGERSMGVGVGIGW
ncbi:ESPR-type extended signal peptide-containing protein [Stenotrophomonas indicatrix]|uniref:ESPR-type extended signal peptide-containing protein n=1 Tax=Stenotrophomonas indicatrix TaxID=2045451 RepID=UPI002655027C|nr:ESPR-type extended signal peptide-containing protein [Stenotrophomonas indicatrix]MDN8645702.1 ESPR-type extended signal peptide-containing protein [Stenotrophomonas indicatrix]MDN8655570.1 ESPR-type extended signal peptide-containing protein [Stenotrophomonas indicatrix]